MERTLIADLKSQAGQKVRLEGWVQTIRTQGSIQFIVLRDISGTVQVVVFDKTLLEQTKHLSLESVVEIIGEAKIEEKAFSGVEVAAEQVKVLSAAEPELPIPIVEKGNMNEADREIRLDWRFLDLRKPEKQLIYKVWTEMERAFVDFLTERRFIEIHSPKMMSTPSESGAELFEVKYFDRKAYLAQSPQFYKQMAMAAGFERVFEIGPVFRAEPSFTTRHATEFQGFDFEMSFIDSHKDVMLMEAEMLAYAIAKVKEKYGEQIKEAFDREVVVPTTPFPEITFAEAKKMLAEKGISSEKENDISPEEERGISEYIKETQNHEFVFITEFPHAGRAFYHMRPDDKPELTKGFDLLWNGIEVTTGAQREHRYDILVKQAEEKGLPLESLQTYLNYFKYGCPPHGGIGAGPERMIMKLLGLESIREVSYLYRGVKRLTP